MPTCSVELKDRLDKKGYNAATLDMSQFIYSGGAVHCVSNNLNEVRVIGGTCVQKNYERKPSMP